MTREGLTFLTAEEMAEFDRATIKDFGIDEVVLMENAGVATATAARRMLQGTVEGKSICCLVGKGNNGGDAMVAARHLHNWGSRISVILGAELAELREAPSKQLVILNKMGIQASGPRGRWGSPDLLVDGLLGYNLKGNPREPMAGLIRRANDSGIMILAVDLPSGLDATSGEPGDPTIVATTTVTFGLPKTGFLNPRAKKFVGELYVADISFPRAIYEGCSKAGGPFRDDPLFKVW